MIQRIPGTLIGILPQILSLQYTHQQINSIFLCAEAPEEMPDGTKTAKVEAWLRSINQNSPEPLVVLGKVLEEFMDQEPPESGSFDAVFLGSRELNGVLDAAFVEPRSKIKKALERAGLHYMTGGTISFAQGTSTQSLSACIADKGMPAVDSEFKRAIENLEKDPPTACLAAASILEAVIKTYLDKKNGSYTEKDTLSDLWTKASQKMKLKPGDYDDKDIKKIASGMFGVVEGLIYLRNRKSAAHGRGERQLKTYNISPRHARLAVHASHTLCVYIIDLMEN